MASVPYKDDSAHAGTATAKDPMRSMDSGEARMAAMGYQQELKRSFNLFTNFGISFGIISILTGVTGSFNIAWNSGGPVAAVWGWVIVSCFTMCVGLSMAEIVSSVPSAGGPYFWASVLGERHGPFFSWVTGWFNLLGQVAVTAAIAFTLTNHLAAMVLLGGGGLGSGYQFTSAQLLGVYGAILVVAGVMNIASTRIIAWLNAFSVVWHITGVVTLIILLPVVAPVTQSWSYVFTQFNDISFSTTGITNNGYLFLVGLLTAQYTITGFDACAHMSEETKGADKSAALAIILAIGASAFFGFAYVLAILFSIQDPQALIFTNDASSADGTAFLDVNASLYVSGQIFYDVFQARYGHGGGGVVVMGIPAIAMMLCTCSSVTSNSRMIWSFARDRGLPGNTIWKRVNRLTGTPMNAIAFAVVVAFLLGLPLIHSTVAFTAVVSISTIGLYISYAIPIFCRLTIGRRGFQPGPFNLGLLSQPIGWTAVIWVLFITAIFVLPTSYPVSSNTLNYAPVAVGIVLLGSITWWILPRIGARGKYKGAAGMAQERAEHPTGDPSIGTKQWVPVPKELPDAITG